MACRSTQCGLGAVGQRRASGVAQFLRLPQGQPAGSAAGSAEGEIQEGPPAVVSTYPQWIQRPRKRAVGRSQGRDSAGAVVPRAAQRTLFGHDHPRTRWPLLCELCRRRVGGTVAGSSGGSRCRCRDQPAGDGCDHRWSADRHSESEAFSPQVTKVAAVGAGEVPPAERITQQGQGSGASSLLYTGKWRGRGGIITTRKLWRWFATTK
jgi:hypothetical protein